MSFSRIISTLVVAASLAHCQMTLFTEAQTGIKLNIPLAKMDENAFNFDKLSLFFLFDSEKEKS
jgi:hypothetical protein